MVEIVGLVHFGYKRYMFCFAFKGPGCWGRCHSLSPVEPRDRNRMMDNNKVMSVCFGAFCFRLVGQLRTSKYVRRSYPVSLTCKLPIMLLCCGFVTRCSCNYIGMPNRVADFSLHSSIPRMWFVSVHWYWFLNLFVCLFVFFLMRETATKGKCQRTTLPNIMELCILTVQGSFIPISHHVWNLLTLRYILTFPIWINDTKC